MNIQTESTTNPLSLKFLLGKIVMEQDMTCLVNWLTPDNGTLLINVINDENKNKYDNYLRFSIFNFFFNNRYFI